MLSDWYSTRIEVLCSKLSDHACTPDANIFLKDFNQRSIVLLVDPMTRSQVILSHSALHSKILQMSNGWRIFRISICCLFAVCLLSDVSDDECFCALFVHWNICAQIVNRTFVHKRLTNILDDYLLSVCAHIRMKGKRKFNENQENNTLGECKQFSPEQNTYIGQQTVDRCFSAQTVNVAWADSYPFAVQTSVNRLLFACSPFAFGLRKEWICNERPITICPIVTCWPHARTTR